MGKILDKVAELEPETRDKTIRTLMDNMDDMTSTKKNEMLQTLLQKVEENEVRLAEERAAGGILLPSSVTAKRANAELKNELIREILKNSKNLDEPQRARILQDVLERARVDAGGPGGGVHGDAVINDVIMQELVSQMDALPQSV